jgi:hypothetical protein
MNQSVNTLTLLTLPHEIIYRIAGEDAGVYNRILRLCYTINTLFPLSRRLDFMETFGVRVEITSNDICWSWNDQLHDIFGPAITYIWGAYEYYYRDELHRIGAPAIVTFGMMAWHIHNELYRDLTAPSGTGMRWLDGIARISDFADTILIEWSHDNHKRVMTCDVGSPEYTQARAEMDYWLARERQ